MVHCADPKYMDLFDLLNSMPVSNLHAASDVQVIKYLYLSTVLKYIYFLWVPVMSKSNVKYPVHKYSLEKRT